MANYIKFACSYVTLGPNNDYRNGCKLFTFLLMRHILSVITRRVFLKYKSLSMFFIFYQNSAGLEN